MVQRRALDGIRVVDFSWVRAGPWATRWLGALGAEIIKIEWPESERRRLPSSTTPQDLEVNLNTSGNFNDTNVNKKSLTLNVRRPKGLTLAKRLIAISDIVIENFSSRVLQNWGLGWEELRRIRPDLVYVSMSGYGHTGRNHHYTTFGPIAQAASGLTHRSGLPGKPPAGWGWSYMVPPVLVAIAGAKQPSSSVAYDGANASDGLARSRSARDAELLSANPSAVRRRSRCGSMRPPRTGWSRTGHESALH
jgi:crotonobetainyl-CoA:carnitine CoA-transferase CaiB-like acyl-CoA transferase